MKNMNTKNGMGFSSLVLSVLFSSCANAGSEAPNAELGCDTVPVRCDTIELQEPLVPLFAADGELNRAAKFYAGVDTSGIELSPQERKKWADYSRQVGKLAAKSFATLSKADSLVGADMSDVRERCDYLFYPFSGPDFLYPVTLFPDADYYFMAGLESAGSVDTAVNADSRYFDKYTSSLKIYMRCSFFRTLSMKKDLRSEEIDGIAPVISMLMALKDCQLVSLRNVDFDEEGAIVDAEEGRKPRMVEFRFFQGRTPEHLQTLYYYSGNMSDGVFPKKLRAYAEATFTKHRVATYLKAASYLMHESYFSKIRDLVLDYSFAVLEDDSGIPYRFFKDEWDVALYGKYLHPISIFNKVAYQKDLEEVYATSDAVKPLPFRIGYNNPSNWLLARKRK